MWYVYIDFRASLLSDLLQYSDEVCLLFRLWEGFAQFSDGTVVTGVEVRPISYSFSPYNYTLIVLALLILLFFPNFHQV